MNLRAPAILICAVASACLEPGEEGENPGRPDGGSAQDAGAPSDAGVPSDGGEPTVDESRPLTLSPEECQADLETLRAEDFEVRKHPHPYKGQVVESRLIGTPDGDKLGAMSVLDQRPLLVQEQAIPGAPDGFTFIYGAGNRVFTAPDYGLENGPDYPYAVIAELVANLDRRQALFRFDGTGRARIELARFDPLGFGGTAQRFTDVRHGPGDDLFFLLFRENDPAEYLVRQSSPGGPISRLLAVGDELSTGDPTERRVVADIHPPLLPTASGDVVVRVDVADGAGAVEGFAWLAVSPLVGTRQCLASNTSILCGGLLVADGDALEFFASDGATLIGVTKATNSVRTLRYRTQGLPDFRELRREELFEDRMMTGFKSVRVCPADNSAFFVATFFERGLGEYDELMRVAEDGSVSFVSDFLSLLRNPMLEGEVPDEIRNFAVGYNCDAVMYTWGPGRDGEQVGYEGYWAAYAGGDVVEVIDETPSRADNGNGAIMGVGRARSGIDPNADTDAFVTIGPDGEFYFAARIHGGGPTTSTYYRATPPKNRCREPVEVNSVEDTPDVSPGDGVCDTGGRVGGEPECTLRAALMETNARSGRDEITVSLPAGSTSRLSLALPAITSPVTLEGNELTLEGAELSGESPGLRILVSEVRLRGLRIQNFPGHGIEANRALVLENVRSRGHCGWGAWLEEGARITGGAFEGNGAGDCTAGGIYSESAEHMLRLVDLSAHDNDGPGIMAQGHVQVSGSVEASRNRGAGVHLESAEGGFVGLKLSQPYGTLDVSENLDHGLSVVGGDLSFEFGRLIARRNCRFGVHADDGKAWIGGSGPRDPSQLHTLLENGQTPPGAPGGVAWGFDASGSPAGSAFPVCGGGGVAIVGLSPDDRSTPNRVSTATISANQGPGLATTDAVDIVDARIEMNFGPGVVFVSEDGDTDRTTTVVRFNPGPRSVVAANSGPGLQVDAGSVRVRSPLRVENNTGAGVDIASGDLSLNMEVGAGRSELRRNGTDAVGCVPWRVEAGVWINDRIGTCAHLDGASTEDGDISATSPSVRDNLGAGFRAADPESEGLGIVQVSGGEVCGNAQADAARELRYEGVDQDCR